MRATRKTPGAPGALEGHAPRRHPRVDGLSAGLEDRGADRRPRPRRRSRPCSAASSARRWWNRPIRCGSPIPTSSTMKVDFRARAGAAGAGVHARPAVPADGRTAAGVHGVRRGDRADRVRARQGLRHGHDAADRLLRRAGRGPHRAAGESRPRHHPAAGAGDGVPLPHLAIPVAPRRGLEGARASPRRSIDWPTLNARSKFWGDDQRAAFKNWEEVADPRNPLGERQGVNERIMLRELLRRVDMMVILENKLDALVRLHTPWPPGMIGARLSVRHRQQPAAGVAVAARTPA